MSFEIWSCNPADIPEWTEEDKARLHVALSGIFGWKKTKMNSKPERQAYQEIHTGKYFQHQDGGLYQFKHFARYSDRSDQYCVVYQHIWPFTSEPWVRPIAEWQPERFKLVTDEYANNIQTQSPELAQQVITARREARKAAAAATEAFNGESGI